MGMSCMAPQVCSVLQTQGCRPQMQETTLHALGVLLTSCLHHAFDVALVPGLEEGCSAAIRHVLAGIHPCANLRFASGSRPFREAILLVGVFEIFQSFEEATLSLTK